MSVMFEADNEEILKERLNMAVSRLKELHQEGLPEIDHVEKTGKPFACFLSELIREALKGAAGEASEGSKEVPVMEDAAGGTAEKAAAEYPETAPYIRLLLGETKRITDRGREEDVIRLELLLQVLGEIACKAEEGEEVLIPDTFQESFYWFYSDYSETVLKHSLTEAAKTGVSFPGEYARTLPYAPGFLEWGDLTELSTVPAKDGEEKDFLILFDANLATRRLEAFAEARKEVTEETGSSVKTDFAVSSELCGQNRNYRHFVKRLGELP